MKRVLVTGGNAGIGLALCRQLCVDHGCHVIMGSRSTHAPHSPATRERASASASQPAMQPAPATRDRHCLPTLRPSALGSLMLLLVYV
jgi:NAD(P)-dependent dehydrogenase (short-subunit alcohol dehydrogenase family)